ncbi:AAA family ATPase [Nocardia sp. NPDC127526]|uniref:AAA family ATPase n=1 Tax=Nocardia sp. NPDC127526 TaxID=3345393 RepID=UPI0036353A67
MAVFALQPASLATKSVAQHYRDTIVTPVSFAEHHDVLDQAALENLTGRFPGGRAQLWGVKPGTGAVNRARYARLQEGDGVAFYGQHRLYAAGRIAVLFSNEKLAERLWGRQDGQTWELMYAVADFQDIDVPISMVQPIMGWGERAVVQGFTLAEDQAAHKLATLCGVELNQPLPSLLAPSVVRPPIGPDARQATLLLDPTREQLDAATSTPEDATETTTHNENADARDTPHAWMIRGTGVDGWLREGWISVTSAQPIVDGVSKEQLQGIVRSSYAHKSYAFKEQRLAELDRFLLQMRVDDLIVAIRRNEVYFGFVTGKPVFTRDAYGSTAIRRPVSWTNIDRPVQLPELPAEVAVLLHTQDYLRDMTAVYHRLIELVSPGVDAQKPAVLNSPRFTHVNEAFAKAIHCDNILWLREIELLLTRRKQLIFYGPPGTGKTYLALNLARHLTEFHAVKLIQFHPSFSYEDFIEGFRPQSDQSNGTISFTLTAGPLRNFVEYAQDDPETPYILIIDEINRAQIDKVFGELYFLLEYRDQPINLQYSPHLPFRLPENLFIIGTMNTTDRSISLPDQAMRRRFAFVELHPSKEPTLGLLDRWLTEHGTSSDMPRVLEELNRRLASDLPEGEDQVIGPSYLMHPDLYMDQESGMDIVWRSDILPLLRELHIDTSIDVDRRYGLAELRRAIQEPQ